MSKTSQKNKELKAAGKKPRKTKAAKSAEAKKAEPKPSVPNEGKCCTCKNYKRSNGIPLPCPVKNGYTPRKGTCESYKLASRFN